MSARCCERQSLVAQRQGRTGRHGHHRQVQARVASLDAKRSSGFSYKPPPFNPEEPPKLEADLLMYDAEENLGVDVLIAGAGPAGIATAARIAEQELSVLVVDPNPLQHWPNNYGVWCDEFRAMNLHDCFEKEWSRANVWLGEKDERFLNRPYARVDRLKLKSKLVDRCIKHGVQFHLGRVSQCSHEVEGSRLMCQDGLQIQTRMIVDATGHARRLTKMDDNHNPGYQAAYGIMADVDEHNFDLDTMLFMDWRDSHLNIYPTLQEENSRLPTFLYAMPFSRKRIFFEETSLVARPGVPFEILKERLYARLNHLGIKVERIVEEEYCLIPMGGVLPRRDQRVVGVGGTAGLVHPSTGYMVARTLGAVPQLADRVVDELKTPYPLDVEPVDELDLRAQRVWASIWPKERLRQREFMTFGMEVLLKLDLAQTQEFFSAFFALSDYHWRGFLSSRLSLPQLCIFGLALFAKSSNAARLDIVTAGLPLFPSMISSIIKAEEQLPEMTLGKAIPPVGQRGKNRKK